MGIVYWDTCIWISHITGIKQGTFDNSGIEEVIKLADENKIKTRKET